MRLDNIESLANGEPKQGKNVRIGFIILFIGLALIIIGIFTAVSAQWMDTTSKDDSGLFGDRETTDIDKVGKQYFRTFIGVGLIFFGIFVCGISARFFVGSLGRGFLMNVQGQPGFGMHNMSRRGYRGYRGYSGYRGSQNNSTVDVVKIKCRNCGYLESEDADFCRKCGEHL